MQRAIAGRWVSDSVLIYQGIARQDFRRIYLFHLGQILLNTFGNGRLLICGNVQNMKHTKIGGASNFYWLERPESWNQTVGPV